MTAPAAGGGALSVTVTVGPGLVTVGPGTGTDLVITGYTVCVTVGPGTATVLVLPQAEVAMAMPMPSAAEVQHRCGNGEWSPLFTSYHDCVVHGANGLTAAGDIGKGIAVGLIISLWVAVDLILGIGRLVVVFARRGR